MRLASKSCGKLSGQLDCNRVTKDKAQPEGARRLYDPNIRQEWEPFYQFSR